MTSLDFDSIWRDDGIIHKKLAHAESLEKARTVLTLSALNMRIACMSEITVTIANYRSWLDVRSGGYQEAFASDTNNTIAGGYPEYTVVYYPQ